MPLSRKGFVAVDCLCAADHYNGAMQRIFSRVTAQPTHLSRRAVMTGALSTTACLTLGDLVLAAQSPAFAHWVAGFRPRALTRGISEQTYDRVMGELTPDTTVFAELNAQPEFTELMWQYISRRCSDWRVITGKVRAREYADLLARIERDYGVDRYIVLGLWGMESSFGDVIANRKYMRPVIPALAALAWGAPRRRPYWEAELLNALTIVDRGWAQPSDMIGSWAGAMGHTQWMPEVWLHLGVDYDHDGRASPFGKPDDSLAGTARYLLVRGNYHRGEAWGCEVTIAPNHARLANNRSMRSYAKWAELGVRRADGAAFARPSDQVKLWLPVAGGPAFLIGQNFRAVYSYNPSTSYTLALCHLGDLIRGDPPFRQQFPGGERTPTLEEVKEIQRRLNEQGFKTDGIDGRTGSDTIRAILAFQKKSGMEPADGYAGLKLLARLRQGP
jgi:membrane-bound lytic murein transglycosylase B